MYTQEDSDAMRAVFLRVNNEKRSENEVRLVSIQYVNTEEVR